MGLSIQQLRSPLTRTEVITMATALINSAGFDTTGWQQGRIENTLLLTFSTIASDFTELVKTIVEFGFNLYSSGDALNEFSKSRFSNSKDLAVPTEGPMLLRNRSTVAYTIRVGESIVQASNGVQFRNTTGGTLPVNGTLSLNYRAIKAGRAGNVTAGMIGALVTSLAGVTVTAAGNPWYTTTGKDEESDASIQRRNATKWPTLALELVGEAYENLARSAGAAKVALDDQNPRGPGTIDVYCAGSASLLTVPELTAIQAAFGRRCFAADTNWPPVAPKDKVWVKGPTPLPISLSAKLYHSSTFTGATILQAAEQALLDLLERTPIGGNDYAPGPTNVITLGDVVDALESLEGVETVVLDDLQGYTDRRDIIMGPLNLAVRGTWVLTPFAIAA